MLGDGCELCARQLMRSLREVARSTENVLRSMTNSEDPMPSSDQLICLESSATPADVLPVADEDDIRLPDVESWRSELSAMDEWLATAPVPSLEVRRFRGWELSTRAKVGTRKLRIVWSGGDASGFEQPCVQWRAALFVMPQHSLISRVALVLCQHGGRVFEGKGRCAAPAHTSLDRRWRD
jgi:hypothetical protein